MIPPFLLSLGGKIGMGVLGAALIAGAIYAYNERLRSQGDVRTEAKYHEQIEVQTQQVQTHDDKLLESRLDGLERMLKEKDQFNAAMLRENKHLKSQLSTAAIQPEVVREVEYVTVEKPVVQPCVVPDELVDRVDHLAGVLNEIPYHRVPGRPEADAERAVSGLSPVACAALVARIETLTSRLGNTLIQSRNLSARAVKQYELYEEFKNAPKE
jgi:hypothetical protein